MRDSTLSSFVSTGGDALAMRDWPLPAGWPTRGVVLLVHGLGEHIGRYDHVAARLNDWGFAVRGYDQVGHGASIGARGGLPAEDRLLSDLAAVIDDTRVRMDDRLPLILLGHSMGGLVAARLVSLKLRRVEGLVLSSPALDVGMAAPLRALVQLLAGVAPGLRLGNGIDPRLLSHDPQVVQAYQNDPLVHDRVTPRLARFIVDGGEVVAERAADWQVPTLLMYAGSDRCVAPAGSAGFAAAAPQARVAAHEFRTLYHEIFNEPEQAEVFGVLHDWLDTLCAQEASHERT